MKCWEDDFPSWGDDEDILMAIDLGYDESGDGKTLLVTMQLGIVRDAKRLKRRWKSMLKKRKIPYFHSVEFRAASGIFSELKIHQREVLLQDLANLIRLRLRIGITMKVDLDYFEKNTSHEFRSQYGTAYCAAINALLLSAHLYMDVFRLGQDVNILVENGHRNSQQAMEILADLQKEQPPKAPVRISSVCLGAKKDHPILQAADMLAYSEWQKLRGGDLTIYNHLHSEGSIYSPEMLDCMDQLLPIFTRKVEELKRNRIEFGKNRAEEIRVRNEEKRRIQKVRRKDEEIVSGSAQRDQGEVGRGESEAEES